MVAFLHDVAALRGRPDVLDRAGYLVGRVVS
jgi:hypothetical protein